MPAAGRRYIGPAPDTDAAETNRGYVLGQFAAVGLVTPNPGVTNCNNATTPGQFYAPAAATNTPGSGGWVLDVCSTTSATTLIQLATSFTTAAQPPMYYRHTQNGGTTWTAWAQLNPVIDTTALNPPGVMEEYAGSTAPTGYLLCDGSAVSRSTYAALFAVIGTTWGAGNGSTTFNVPDMRGRSPLGATTGFALGSTGGSATHTHALSDNGNAQLFMNSTAITARTLTGRNGYTPTSRGSYTNGGAVNNQTAGVPLDGATDAGSSLHPYAAVNFIIKT